MLALISLFLCFGEQLQNMWQSLCQSQNFYWGHWQWLIVVWKCPGCVLVRQTFTVPNPNQWWFDLEFLWRLLWSHLHCDENYTKSVWAVDCNHWPWITTQSGEHLDLVTSNHTLRLVSEHNARQQTTLDKWSADNITPIVLRFIHEIQKYIFPELASYFLAKMIFWGTYYWIVRLLWCAHTCPPSSLLYFL